MGQFGLNRLPYLSLMNLLSVFFMENILYYVEMQVWDISIVYKRLEMMTPCVQSILTVRNDDRLCTHSGTGQLERITCLIRLMTSTSALLTRTFL